MPDWTLHWLEAEGDLQPWRAAIEAEIGAAHDAVSKLLSPPRLDILVQRLSGAVIPEIGMVGHAFRRALFTLTLDPDNPHFAAALADGVLRRQAAHEVHHCLRMAGPGYGRTLGEALVSEGLAGHFTRRLFANPPEPWECAVDGAVLRAHMPDAASLASTEYGHAAWFYGDGSQRPRWLGYTLGYALVGAWLEAGPLPDGPAFVGTPAEAILAAGLTQV